MAKRVLDVGQCVPDHAAICSLLERRFGAEVLAADDLEQTLAALRQGPVDLVLVNRKLDADYSDGLEIIRHIKSDPHLAAVPVMLVTNYPEYQQQAVAAGAAPGFGKAELSSPATLEKLAEYVRTDRA
jgi:CheY-like chemotaxis protein